MSRIYYTKPRSRILRSPYATDAATNGWGERCYDYIHRFEARSSITLASNMRSQHQVDRRYTHGPCGFGLGQGDEVILGDINWIASAAPITYLGAKPVFVDILPTTWCLDPARVEAAITPRTKAILAVHLYGNLCDMDALLAIGAKHGIPVIEDAAEAMGSQWHGNRAGTMGTFGTFSVSRDQDCYHGRGRHVRYA